MIFSIGLVFLAVFMTAISQVILKVGSKNFGSDKHFLVIYLNIYTICAYAILLIVTIISTIALIQVPLKLFAAIASLNFVFVILLSWIFLKENIDKKIFLGILFIALGLLVFNL